MSLNIQAINNQPSFKAVFSQKGVNFSKPQKRVIDDIKNKTNSNEDFFVENGAKKEDIKEKLNDGLGYLLKIMAKYGA